MGLEVACVPCNQQNWFRVPLPIAKAGLGRLRLERREAVQLTSNYTYDRISKDNYAGSCFLADKYGSVSLD